MPATKSAHRSKMAPATKNRLQATKARAPATKSDRQARSGYEGVKESASDPVEVRTRALWCALTSSIKPNYVTVRTPFRVYTAWREPRPSLRHCFGGTLNRRKTCVPTAAFLEGMSLSGSVIHVGEQPHTFIEISPTHFEAIVA